jgi:hypothetical protein
MPAAIVRKRPCRHREPSTGRPGGVSRVVFGINVSIFDATDVCGDRVGVPNGHGGRARTRSSEQRTASPLISRPAILPFRWSAGRLSGTPLSGRIRCCWLLATEDLVTTGIDGVPCLAVPAYRFFFSSPPPDVETAQPAPSVASAGPVLRVSPILAAERTVTAAAGLRNGAGAPVWCPCVS